MDFVILVVILLRLKKYKQSQNVLAFVQLIPLRFLGKICND